jgi:F-type H+-transporting ATPase subunit b
MKKIIVPILLLGLAIAPRGWAQESSGGSGGSEKAASSESAGEEDHLGPWKWANFLLLAGLLGYFAVKNGGPFFAARSKDIRREMVEAAEARKAAEARSIDVDRRLANLEAEIAALRAEAQREEQADTQRIARDSAAEIAKIQAHAQQEIASAAKAARMELKRYSADLAIKLAEQKIRERLTPEKQDALVRGFVRDVDAPASRVQTT